MEFEALLNGLRGMPQPDSEQDAAVLSSWCEINTYSRNLEGLERFRAVLADAFHQRLPQASLRDVVVPEYKTLDGSLGRAPAALQISCRPEAPVQLLLSGHMDTVFPPEDGFLSCRQEGERLMGPGVSDMKGGILVMLEALALVEAYPEASKPGWEVLLTTDEELGSPASADLIRERARAHRFGLVFESALPDGSIIRTRKGAGSYRLVTRGRAAHTGRDFEAGRNALTAMCLLGLEVERLNLEFPGEALNLGRMTGGGAINVVPDWAEAWANVRASTRESAEAIDRRIRQLADLPELARREISATVAGGFSRMPRTQGRTDQWLVETYQACSRAAGEEIGARDTGGSSDGNLLCEAGLPHLDGIGVRGGNIHSHEEFAIIPSIRKRAQLAAAVMLGLATKEHELPPDNMA